LAGALRFAGARFAAFRFAGAFFAALRFAGAFFLAAAFRVLRFAGGIAPPFSVYWGSGLRSRWCWFDRDPRSR
jgi:hypothetical protein